jgi:hypothetical protein
VRRDRELAQLYAEMYESGHNPNRGLGPVMVAATLCTLLGVAGLLLFPSLGLDLVHSLSNGWLA